MAVMCSLEITRNKGKIELSMCAYQPVDTKRLERGRKCDFSSLEGRGHLCS